MGSELWQDLVSIFVLQLFTCSAHGEQEGGLRFTLQEVDEIHCMMGVKTEDPAGSERFREDAFDTVIDTLRTLRYFTAMCHMLQTAVKTENIFKKRSGETESQKYWKSSIRKTLQNVMYILKPINGVLAKYIVSNGCSTRLVANPGEYGEDCEKS